LSLKKKTSYSPSQTISNFGINDTSAEESKRKVKYGYDGSSPKSLAYHYEMLLFSSSSKVTIYAILLGSSKSSQSLTQT
jgi:hypothetical protein